MAKKTNGGLSAELANAFAADEGKGFDPEKVKSFIDKNAGSAFGAVAEAGKQFEGVKQGFGRFLRGLENRGMK